MEEKEESVDPIQEESKEYFGSVASTEYQQMISRLKYENRRAKISYLRALGRSERKRLREKYLKSN